VVEELQTLWTKGFQHAPKDANNQEHTYYAAVISIACDVPAARKVSGFLSHSASMGCNVCEKKFTKCKSLSAHFVVKNNSCPTKPQEQFRTLFSVNKLLVFSICKYPF
jgi:hypothetical protein